jgi:hypothetical protein
MAVSIGHSGKGMAWLPFFPSVQKIGILKASRITRRNEADGIDLRILTTMTKSIYGCYQIGDRLHTRDGDSRALRAMACSQLAAMRQRSSAGKESGHGLKIHQERKTKNGFAAFAPLPHCGKRASGWQEQDAADAVGAGQKRHREVRNEIE